MLAVKLALDRVPAYQEEIKAWVHRQTGYHIALCPRIAGVAMVRPGIVIPTIGAALQRRPACARARRAAGGSAPTSGGSLRAASCSPGVSSSIRRTSSSRGSAGRVSRWLPRSYCGARMRPSSGVEPGRPADRPLVIRERSVTVAHWNSTLPQLVSRVNLDITRDAGVVAVKLAARLPPALGGTLIFRGQGARAGGLDSLAWTADCSGRATFPSPGGGSCCPNICITSIRAAARSHSGARPRPATWRARIRFRRAERRHAAERRRESAVRSNQRLALALTHEGDRWTLLGRGVRASRHGRAIPISRVRRHVARRPRGAARIACARELSARRQPAAPRGTHAAKGRARPADRDIADGRMDRICGLPVARRRRPIPGNFRCSAKFRAAGFAPVGRAAGLRGLTGSLAGDQNGGRTSPWMPARRCSPGPTSGSSRSNLTRSKITLYWRRTPEDLLVATPRSRSRKSRRQAAREGGRGDCRPTAIRRLLIDGEPPSRTAMRRQRAIILPRERLRPSTRVARSSVRLRPPVPRRARGLQRPGAPISRSATAAACSSRASTSTA